MSLTISKSHLLLQSLLSLSLSLLGPPLEPLSGVEAKKPSRVAFPL